MPLRNFQVSFKQHHEQPKSVKHYSAPGKDGGFELMVRQLGHGLSVPTISMVGVAKPDGTLTVTIWANGTQVTEVTTHR